jgi:D-alanine-D-alanine ligase
MRVALIYDLFSDYPRSEEDPADAAAENEPIETVEALEQALRSLGHEPVRVGPPAALLAQLPALRVDAAVNIAEGAWTRNREGWAPSLLEMAGIPCLGSDALTLSLSLDKAWTKDLATAAGVTTPAYRVYAAADDIRANDLPGPFPLFVKPRYEGSAKGISTTSRVEDERALRETVWALVREYRQPVLVEPFIDGGGEFTVAVVGNGPARALPALQRAVERESRIGLHVLDREGLPDRDLDFDLPGELTEALEDRLQRDAISVYDKLECRDFARIDFRVDGGGTPWFLEINPLPTFAPDGTFAILAELMGVSYDRFLSDLLGEAFQRLTTEPGPRSYLEAAKSDAPNKRTSGSSRG